MARQKTMKKLERVKALIEGGMTATAACKQVGLAPVTYRTLNAGTATAQPEKVERKVRAPRTTLAARVLRSKFSAEDKVAILKGLS